MFDSRRRLIHGNGRYADLFDLPPELAKPGTPLLDILHHGAMFGPLPDEDPKSHVWRPLDAADRAGHSAALLELKDGRIVRVSHQPTTGGGWLSTYDDITGQTRIGNELAQARAALGLEEEAFDLLFDSNPVPMWVFDRESLRFLAVNNAAVERYGYSRDQFLSMTILDIRPKEEWEAARSAAGREWTAENGSTWRHKRADGGELLVDVYARSITYEGRSGQLVAVVDGTERLKARDELRRAQEFLAVVIESIPDAIFVRDARSGRFILLNKAAEDFLGMTRENVIGKLIEEVYPATAIEEITRQDEELLRNGELAVDSHAINLRSGDSRFITLNRILLKGADGAPLHMLAVIRDVTERARADKRIAHLALHDPLTDLPNRTAFNERLAAILKASIDTGDRFAILSIDLDHLKEVNDIFGHASGDQLLCEVSRRLLAVAEGGLVARIGGDEFALIAKADRAASIALADRVIDAVSGDLDILGEPIRTSLGIGIAIFPDDGGDATTLLANADAALHRAKKEGPGVSRSYTPEMDKKLRERRSMRRELASAIERGELVVFYQPQAEIAGKITGFEALLRWRHPTRGWVSPGTFIPLAEESRLIVPIGEWVLREVCREAASWPLPLGVAVNLSPVQFQHSDLPGLIRSILLETGLASNQLELEITEGVLMDDSGRIASILREVKALGVRIAMDDFGSGYSSLSYLQSFPFDKIKIDRTFVTKIEDNPQSAAIVRAVLGLAHGLRLPVLAEGVETEEELAFLAREGCDHVQGYYIGRPLPIAEYAGVVGRI
ncbi:diguanylate cyclase (GGDEF)-like protein/PAS domain S-box-containing protein [Labrys monachus]|uniref:Diguanylate cyclase (GGDEF)-like protein/PAS domain S-box-containing protein n=2 Tax=Labrys monachus TaxID=217067 RepID=A0ABU0FM56_9HYPH|nr:diguanylate cyclase (GGDEF)-like protein/PAS domain S-box-containing protein [Labrys monachus]